MKRIKKIKIEAYGSKVAIVGAGSRWTCDECFPEMTFATLTEAFETVMEFLEFHADE